MNLNRAFIGGHGKNHSTVLKSWADLGLAGIEHRELRFRAGRPVLYVLLSCCDGAYMEIERGSV